MILTTEVLVELVTGGPDFEKFARAVEKTPDPTITPLTLASLVKMVCHDYGATLEEAVRIVERLLGEIGVRIVPVTYEMAIDAASFDRRLAPGEFLSIDDAFAFAAAKQLRANAMTSFDILGPDGVVRGEEGREEKRNPAR